MKTASARLLGGMAFCLLAMYGVSYATALATSSPYPWIYGTPTLNKLQTYTVTAASPAPANIVGNEPTCNNDSFIWRPDKFVNLIKVQNQASLNVCSFKTNGGEFATLGYIRLNGTKVAGRITGPAGDNGSFVAIPNSGNAIELTNGTGGSYIKILDNAYSGLQVTKNNDGSVAYKTTKTSPTLRNKYNQLLSVQFGSLAYSDDGNWLVADAQSSGMVRINVKTHEILPFADGFAYSNGSSPSLQTAISNDGRYAVVASFSYNSFKVYDLESCVAVANSAAQNCQSRDLLAYVKTQVPTLYGSADKIRFITNDTFSFYTTYDRVGTNNRKIGLFSLTTPGIVAAKMDYLAMGDSFASGEGAYSYRAGTDFADNRCHQSEISYPYLLDAKLSTGLFKSVACSGAKIRDVMELDPRVYNSHPQGKNKFNENYDLEVFDNFLPGYRAQLNFVTKNSPSIITISTGGNDIGFAAIIQTCVTTPSTCYQFREPRQELVRNINNTYPGLVDMYRSIKQQATPDAKIYVIGYPQIAKIGGNCAANVHFDSNEVVFGKQLIDYLNSVIKMAADSAGVAYVDTSNAFNGYRLCETASSGVAVNGLTAGNSAPLPGIGPLGSESYHPNDLGHRLFADTIAAATNNFTLPSPVATNAVANFASEESLEFLTSVPKDYRDVYDSHYSDNLSDNAAIINQASKIYIDSGSYTLKPNAPFNLTLYSTPTSLGTVTTDANGEINSTFTIPTTVEPGYHTLHARGEAITGELIDIQKIIYVAANEADYDGDGTNNTNEACVIGEASEQDIDKDGVDDACDAVIGEPPAEVITPPAPDPTPIIPPVENPQPTEPSPLPDPVDPQTSTPPETPVLPPIDNPAPPVVVESEKVLPESESNPQWLLDLTTQKQAELNARLLASATQQSTQSSFNTFTAVTMPPQEISSPTTVVAGASVSNAKEVAATVPPQSYTRQTPELAVLLIAIGLLSFGVLLVLWKLNKQKN